MAVQKDSLQSTGVLKNKWVRIALLIIVVTFIIAVISYIIKAQKLASATAGEIIGGVLIEQQTGISVPRQQVCREVSADCEKAVTRLPIVGTAIWCTDDEVVNALNRLVSENEAKHTCTLYKQLTGESLKALVEGGLFVESNRRKITYRTSLT